MALPRPSGLSRLEILAVVLEGCLVSPPIGVGDVDSRTPYGFHNGDVPDRTRTLFSGSENEDTTHMGDAMGCVPSSGVAVLPSSRPLVDPVRALHSMHNPPQGQSLVAWYCSAYCCGSRRGIRSNRL